MGHIHLKWRSKHREWNFHYYFYFDAVWLFLFNYLRFVFLLVFHCCLSPLQCSSHYKWNVRLHFSFALVCTFHIIIQSSSMKVKYNGICDWMFSLLCFFSFFRTYKQLNSTKKPIIELQDEKIFYLRFSIWIIL